MSNQQAIRKCLCAGLIGAVLLVIPCAKTLAQVSPDVAEYGYAKTIFVNGKIVSMDDYSASASVGTVYQAVAVKGEKIIKLGTSAEVRALAGPERSGVGLGVDALTERGSPMRKTGRKRAAGPVPGAAAL